MISFAWQGGEPTLLGVDFFRKVIRLQTKYANGKKIENGFQTNGVLLDNRWGEFLANHQFLVGISIDGPEHLHNRYRLDKGGQASFRRVMNGLDYLKKHQVEFNTLTVVQKSNSRHPIEVYRFLKEVGSGFIQFIPVVEREVLGSQTNNQILFSTDSDQSAQVTPWSVESLQYGNFLCSIFDEWVRNDVGRQYIQLFDVALESWMGMDPSLCVFRETCGTALAMEHNGDLYSCDHYVYPKNLLGNIMQDPLGSLVNSPQQTEFGQAKQRRLPRYCQECEVRFACNGECPKHRFIKTPQGEDGLNYLCAGYKLFFQYINPYMRFMADELRQGRAPANVMPWARMHDLDADGKRRPGRNDPCLCGSGRKYKRCCGG